ncbi:MAG: hypothetical protein MK052_07855 [Alphaproteobacteria bacterium]|nr:hypothetical protein [Alphaproteobacteria bacterium]
MTRFLRIYGIFIGLFVAQIVFWSQTHSILPNMAIVPDVPGRNVVKALSLGDEQFYFRLLALNIQNSGDTYGRFTPLKDYNYDKLSKWFSLLDSLDNKSDYIPSLATYYYSQTQNRPDVRYIVRYLQDHVHGRVEEKWWWLIQAMYLANHKLDDKGLALEVGKPLMDAKTIPMWARQFPAFIYEQQGEMEQALYVMQHVLAEAEQEKLSKEDFNFMKYFIEERLEKGLPEGFEKYRPDENKQEVNKKSPRKDSRNLSPAVKNLGAMEYRGE